MRGPSASLQTPRRTARLTKSIFTILQGAARKRSCALGIGSSSSPATKTKGRCCADERIRAVLAAGTPILVLHQLLERRSKKAVGLLSLYRFDAAALVRQAGGAVAERLRGFVTLEMIGSGGNSPCPTAR
jgi:hypothetical protein